MGKLRIAIVGCGGIANQKHMPSIKTQADKAEMVAFCDIIPERAEKAAKEYGVEGAKVYTDYKEMLADTKMLHAGSFGMSADPSRTAHFEAMKLAKKLGKLISYDVNYRNMIWSFEDAKKVVDEVLPYVDLLKISDEELDFVGGEANIPAMMKENQISVVIETLGAKGAKFFFAGQEETVEGHKVKAVDATGAGDAFWGGFLASLLMNGVTTADDLTVDKIREALKYGNASGGLCVQKMGGIPALPTKEEIEAFLK